MVTLGSDFGFNGRGNKQLAVTLCAQSFFNGTTIITVSENQRVDVAKAAVATGVAATCGVSRR